MSTAQANGATKRQKRAKSHHSFDAAEAAAKYAVFRHYGQFAAAKYYGLQQAAFESITVHGVSSCQRAGPLLLLLLLLCNTDSYLICCK